MPESQCAKTGSYGYCHESRQVVFPYRGGYEALGPLTMVIMVFVTTK